MTKFLHKVAQHLLRKHGHNMSALTVLMPNRRMCVFFREALQQESTQALWLPEIIPLRDWILDKSSLVQAAPLELILELFEVFKDNGGEETLDEFIPVAQVMIEDFNEVDRQLIDAAPFFRELQELQSLKVYVPGEEPDKYAIRYRKFWHLFRVSYFIFKDKLKEKSKGYEGMIYREVAGQIGKILESYNTNFPSPTGDVSPSGGVSSRLTREGVGGGEPLDVSTTRADADQTQGPQFAAIGFNYLTKSEEKILQSIHRTFKADIIWDTDRYFVADDYQEAGMFFRKYIREWRVDNKKWQEDTIGLDEKEINIIGVAKSVGQTKVVSDILSDKLKLTVESEKNTVIVVPDETLLNPLLTSLPGNISTYNISMGYPLRESLPAGLLKLLFTLHDNAEKFQSQKHKRLRFHYRDVFDVLHHPYAAFLLTDKDATAAFVETIRKRNRMLVTLDEISVAFAALPFDRLFWYTDDVNEYLQKLQGLIDALRGLFATLTQSETEDRSVDIELLFFLHKTIRNIQNVFAANQQDLTVQSLRKLLSDTIRTARVPFDGEPVKGLQIMGVLETQGLDFENVIILSMNEGIFPSGKKHNSYIPMDVKRKFLSTYKEKDAESAYLFLRLLERSNKVFLLYNTESDELGGGEKSRFILQLQYELQKANPQAIIKDLVYSVDPPPRLPEDDLIIYKDETLLAQLALDLNTIGISPSAINTYINCSLQYYLRYPAKLRQQDDVEESIEAATLGSAVHDVLENLYKEKLEQPLSAQFVDSILKDKKRIEALTKKAFGHRFDAESLTHGKNYLLYRVCLKLLDEFLKHEKNHLEFLQAKNEQLKLLMLEKKMEQLMQIGEFEIKIAGKVDRVEETNGIISVADYKTGNPTGSVIKTDDVALFATDPKYAKAMQLLTYAWLYWRSNGSGNIQLRSGIYWLRQIADGFDALTLDKSELINRNILLQFEDVLKSVLTSLLDPALPFQKTSDVERCRNCEFIRICRRE